MKAATVTIGDEILIGQVVNTNATYLSKKLFSIGIPVERSVTVPDSRNEIIKEFREAYKAYDVIIVTGGLGPTHDDITKSCIAEFFKDKLVFDKRVFLNITKIFQRRRIPMPEINKEQAMVPESAKILPNHFGTAPGLLIEKNKKVFCAMPGVPFEMKHMTEEQLLPYLAKRFKNSKGKKIILQKTLHTIGISESLLFEKVGDIKDITKSTKDKVIKIAFLPSNYETRIRINVEAENKQTAERKMKETVTKLKKRVGRYIYSFNDEPIEKTVGLMLKRRKLTLSAAESCTGGLVASKITDVSGSSDYFIEGAVTYSNESKIKITGVKRVTLKRYGAVSKQTAIEMAKGIRKVSGSDIGISTTGIAGPAGAAKNKPVGLVWIGYSDKHSSFAKEFIFTKDRLRNKEIMSKMALEIVRRKLLGIKLDND